MCDISGQPPRHPDATPTPRHHPTSKVARNSATQKFNTAHKRCNTNGLISKFERFTWNYVRHFRATTPILGRRLPDTQASYPTTAHTQPTPRPHLPSPPPPQKSHVIRLPKNSTPPTNVAIPTVWFQSLKGLHGIMCDIFRQPRPTVPTHANTSTHANHRAPASSHASARDPAQASSRARDDRPAQWCAWIFALSPSARP